jgi:recombination protein RecA
MAKAKTNNQVDSLEDIFASVAKKNSKFEIADEAVSLQDKGFISTGSMALNTIMAGSLYEGIPKGGIIAFAGRESTGKTYICKSIIKEAQKQDIGVIIFDTEGAYSKKDLITMGIDPKKILFQDADTITNFQVDVCQLLKELHEQYPEREWLVVVDSVANFVSTKEEEDTFKKGDPKSDQGQRAKQLKAASRIVQKAVCKNNATLVLTNHTYEKPGAYPGVPPEQVFSGGSGFLYMSHQIVFLKKYLEKEEVETHDDKNKKKKTSTGIKVTAITAKNRVCPEGKSINFYINYKHGLLPYIGLIDLAVQFEFLEPCAGGWFYVPHLDKKVRGPEQVYSKEVWKPILEDLNKKVVEEYAFPDAGNDALLEDIESDANEEAPEEEVVDDD